MRALLVAEGVHTLVGARPVDTPAAPQPVRAIVVESGRIVWTGEPSDAPTCDRTVDLGAAWVTPAFVDAHVHGTATGLSLSGCDLTAAGGLADCLRRVREHAAGMPADDLVLGSGWDDFAWPEQRPPTAQELSEAAGGRLVHLARVDAHSCVVDARTLRDLPLDGLEGVERDAAGEPTGWLKEAASAAAWTHVRALQSPQRLEAARAATCARAAELGIATLHEMGHPGLSGLDDALAWANQSWPIEVLAWWAELDADTAGHDGLRPGGDLFLDGSIGSGTAAVSGGYAGEGGNGELFHEDAAIAEFFVDCSRAGLGGGVHAIGDRAIEQAVAGIEAAADLVGVDAVRACRHRIEHAELVDADQVGRMARLGVVASIQPAFDATWGGDGGLYAGRFGVDVARRSNPFVWFRDAGVPLAFSSDAPVTPLDPWAAVLAAEQHLGGLGISRYEALAAHTVGGRHAGGQDDIGRITSGQRADLAVWNGDPMRASDPRGLTCLATLVAGHAAHGDLADLVQDRTPG